MDQDYNCSEERCNPTCPDWDKCTEHDSRFEECQVLNKENK